MPSRRAGPGRAPAHATSRSQKPSKLRSQFGGTIIGEPFNVMNAGRMVLLKDPQGATVAAWQSKSHIGAGIIDEIGSPCWSELNTSDSFGVEKFYESVFGWGVRTGPMQADTYTE